jgi:hypothetical protein
MSHLFGATTTRRGAIVLAGHLGGTANSPTVTNHDTIASGDLHTEYLLASGGRALTSDLPFGGNKATGLADGVANDDAATYGQVLGFFRGIDYKESVRVATAAALPASTRVVNVITASANGSINDVGIDGVTDLALNDRVLVKNEGSSLKNGIYYVSAVGSGGAPWSLTRAVDADSDAEVTSGLTVSVEEGTTLAGHTFKLTTANPITLNTTGLAFTDMASAVSFGSVDELAPGAPSNGAASTAARSDHNHGTLPATGGDDFGSSAARWDFFGADVNFSGKHVEGLTAIDDTDSPYSLGASDYRLQVATGAGAVTINLPAAASNTGRVIKVKRVGANNVVLDGNSSETIDGAATLTLDADYESVTLFCDGTGWNIE